MPTEPLDLTLSIDDPDVLAWLSEFDEADRPAKAATALRIGVLALRQAAGFVDRQAIKDEGALLTATMETQITQAMGTMVGPDSQLMKTLDPQRADGLIAQLREALDTELTEHGEHITGAFSLDDPASPLSRLVSHVRESQDAVRKEFSLDDDNSGLSRLLRQVTGTLVEHEKVNAEFREQVQRTLSEMAVRKEAEARGTTHGLAFEDALTDYVAKHAEGSGDVSEATGARTGVVKSCKVGDCVLELSPDNSAAGAKIVFEAKESASYSLPQALEEIGLARRNRGAQVGVFVFSARTVPQGVSSLHRFGRDVVVVWDAEDPATDVQFDAAILLAKAMALDVHRDTLPAVDVDFDSIDKAIEAVAKRAERTDQIRTWGQTIESTGAKIVGEMDIARKDLDHQVEILRQRIDEARRALAAAGG